MRQFLSRAGLPASFPNDPDLEGWELGNPTADISSPEAKRKIHRDYDHQQGQDRIPLSADSFELGPDSFGLYQDDENEQQND